MADTLITIGAFDGVHVGHQSLISAGLTSMRQRLGQTTPRVVALSFDPHPLTVLRPDAAPTRLSSFGQRERWLKSLGVDEIERLVPTPDLLGLSAEAFIDRMVEKYAPAAWAEGPGFRFGRGREGDVETLRDAGRRLGFDVFVPATAEAVLSDHTAVVASSSRIRWLLEHGRVCDAASVLSRPYTIETTVVEGARRGRDLGFPTANLDQRDWQLPRDGIYAGRAHHPAHGWFAAGISVGTNPSFNGSARSCEAHLIDYDGRLDDYGWTIQLSFTHWLRDQISYGDLRELSRQIGDDVMRAQELVSVSDTQ